MKKIKKVLLVLFLLNVSWFIFRMYTEDLIVYQRIFTGSGERCLDCFSKTEKVINKYIREYEYPYHVLSKILKYQDPNQKLTEGIKLINVPVFNFESAKRNSYYNIKKLRGYPKLIDWSPKDVSNLEKIVLAEQKLQFDELVLKPFELCYQKFRLPQIKTFYDYYMMLLVRNSGEVSLWGAYRLDFTCERLGMKNIEKKINSIIENNIIYEKLHDEPYLLIVEKDFPVGSKKYQGRSRIVLIKKEGVFVLSKEDFDSFIRSQKISNVPNIGDLNVQNLLAENEIFGNKNILEETISQENEDNVRFLNHLKLKIIMYCLLFLVIVFILKYLFVFYKRKYDK